MKTTPRQFRLTAEDLDNIRFIKEFYAEMRYTDTDVIRTTLRERRFILESCEPWEDDPVYDTFIEDDDAAYERIMSELEDLREDSGAINPRTDEDDRLPF